MRRIELLALVLLPLPGSLRAQDTVPPPTPVVQTGSVSPVESTPPPPTPAQTQYMDGLRTAGRGIAQLRSGVERVLRLAGRPDSAQRSQAASRLAGMCGASRGFMASGRAKMQPNAYEDSTRIKARRLAVRVDSLIRFVPSCETRARRAPDQTATELLGRLRDYEAALRDFRLAIGLPVKDPTTP